MVWAALPTPARRPVRVVRVVLVVFQSLVPITSLPMPRPIWMAMVLLVSQRGYRQLIMVQQIAQLAFTKFV
jgi:hypothetical protein